MDFQLYYTYIHFCVFSTRYSGGGMWVVWGKLASLWVQIEMYIYNETESRTKLYELKIVDFILFLFY